MAELFLGRIGHMFFFVVIIIYLYGDVAIYATTVPQSLLKVTQANYYIGSLLVTEDIAYWFYLSAFLLILGPLCFFDFQKTRILQYLTMAIRNVSLLAYDPSP